MSCKLRKLCNFFIEVPASVIYNTNLSNHQNNLMSLNPNDDVISVKDDKTKSYDIISLWF